MSIASTSNFFKPCAYVKTRARPTTVDAIKESQTQKQLGYVTDINGNLEIWDCYIDNSRVLYRIPNATEGRRPLLDLGINCEIVFGGNITGKGSGDIRIMREILSLKERYPSRVHIILGSLEISRMRIPFELTDAMLYEKTVTFYSPEEEDSSENFQLNSTNLSISDRTLWILGKTMKCPESFENRHHELSELGYKHAGSNHVAQSYVDLSSEDGLQSVYLSKGSFATIVADTLFLHNVFALRYIGYIPSYRMKEASKRLTLREWVHEMNKYTATQIDDFMQNTKMFTTVTPTDCWIKVGGYGHDQPGSNLVNFFYQCDLDDEKDSPIGYHRHIGSEQHTLPLDESVCAWLRDGQITQVIAGNQHSGDCPKIMELEYNIKLILANVSECTKTEHKEVILSDDFDLEDDHYRQHGLHHKHAQVVDRHTKNANTFCELILIPSHTVFKSCKTIVHGIFSDGLPYLFNIPERLSHGFLGITSTDGWTVKAILADKKCYLLAKEILEDKNGYHTENVAVPKEVILSILAHGFPPKVAKNSIQSQINEELSSISSRPSTKLGKAFKSPGSYFASTRTLPPGLQYLPKTAKTIAPKPLVEKDITLMPHFLSEFSSINESSFAMSMDTILTQKTTFTRRFRPKTRSAVRKELKSVLEQISKKRQTRTTEEVVKVAAIQSPTKKPISKPEKTESLNMHRDSLTFLTAVNAKKLEAVVHSSNVNIYPAAFLQKPKTISLLSKMINESKKRSIDGKNSEASRTINTTQMYPSPFPQEKKKFNALSNNMGESEKRNSILSEKERLLLSQSRFDRNGIVRAVRSSFNIVANKITVVSDKNDRNSESPIAIDKCHTDVGEVALEISSFDGETNNSRNQLTTGTDIKEVSDISPAIIAANLLQIKAELSNKIPLENISLINVKMEKSIVSSLSPGFDRTLYSLKADDKSKTKVIIGMHTSPIAIESKKTQEVLEIDAKVEHNSQSKVEDLSPRKNDEKGGTGFMSYQKVEQISGMDKIVKSKDYTAMLGVAAVSQTLPPLMDAKTRVNSTIKDFTSSIKMEKNSVIRSPVQGNMENTSSVQDEIKRGKKSIDMNFEKSRIDIHGRRRNLETIHRPNPEIEASLAVIQTSKIAREADEVQISTYQTVSKQETATNVQKVHKPDKPKDTVLIPVVEKNTFFTCIDIEVSDTFGGQRIQDTSRCAISVDSDEKKGESRPKAYDLDSIDEIEYADKKLITMNQLAESDHNSQSSIDDHNSGSTESLRIEDTLSAFNQKTVALLNANMTEAGVHHNHLAMRSLVIAKTGSLNAKGKKKYKGLVTSSTSNM